MSLFGLALATCAPMPTQVFPTHIPATFTPLPSPIPASTGTPVMEDAIPMLVPRTMDFPDPSSFEWTQIADGFTRPLGLVAPPDGSGRLLVVEQDGLVKTIITDQVQDQVFIDLRDRASTKGSSVHGLLGLAFHPDFNVNGYFFINYTDASGKTVISRFSASPDKNQGDPASEVKMLAIDYPYGEHIGGAMEFGPDGMLYISVGDGGKGGYGDQAGNAQNPNTLPGSILRLDVNNGNPYAIPADNPFPSGSAPEVWAYGLRNPWRISFDALTGDLFIADVGENLAEEINVLPAGSPGGANFGWNMYEGNQPFASNAADPSGLSMPVVEYDHSLGCCVTGGKVYRGSQLPALDGIYFYADYCSGNIWGMLKNGIGNWESQLMFNVPAYITTFGSDQAGELYLTGSTGRVYKLTKK